MRVLVTGGTGFVGRHLVRRLRERGDDVVVATRSAARVEKAFGEGVAALEWDPLAGPPALEGFDGVVNLMGENIGKGRWTRAKKRRIHDSRVLGTRNLVAGFAAHPPRVLVSTSAIGYYGPTGHNRAHENSPAPAGDYLADLCREWEGEAIAAREHGVRVAIVRSGVILGREDGAYPPLRLLSKCFLGGTIDLGKAWFSWVHIDDVVGVYLHCLDHEEAREAYNATAPHPVSNMEFTRELARSLHRPVGPPVPSFALRLMKGEFGKYITMSQRIEPIRTLGIGYRFKYPRIRGALEALAGSPA